MAVLNPILFLIASCYFNGISAQNVYNAVETEMFAIPISPNIFNWTYQEFDQQYRFHAALVGKPDLPYWMRYIYSNRHHSGFVFGTPPRGTKSPITIEVIGLNRQDYETRRLVLTLQVKPRAVMAKYEIELKIDNLNVEDLLDNHRMIRLKDIFRSKLWPESKGDLYATFLASAIDLGARLPLKPNDGEGLVIRLGSTAPFSNEVKDLREEVRPLSRLTNCPREYKRTSVERMFRDAGLTLDWCSFELYNTIHNERTTELVEYLSKTNKQINKSDNMKGNLEIRRSGSKDQVWNPPSLRNLPMRDYCREKIAATLIPFSLMLLGISILTTIMCVRFVGMPDPESQRFFDNVFELFIDRRNSSHSANVELCRYGTGNTEQTQDDNISSKSLVGNSPNNSLVRPYSPKSTTNLAGNYNRPQPPPYMASHTNNIHQKITIDNQSTSGLTPEHARPLALEESIKLLNNAKISAIEYVDSIKDRIIDLNNGADDYVPVEEGKYMDNIVVGNTEGFLTEGGVGGALPVKTWFC